MKPASTSEPTKTLAASLLEKFAVEKISPKQVIELEGFIGSLSLKDNPENNPEVLRAVAVKLEEMGCRRQEIHEKSLVLASDADKAAADINRLVTSAKEPTENYRSNVGIYHFTVGEVGGKRVFLRSGLNAITAWGETIVRKSGDLGGNVFTKLFSTPLRHKANISEIQAKVVKLGLQKHFKNDNESILEEIGDVRSGAILDDLLRLRSEHPFLQKLDPQEGLAAAAKMVAEVHASSGVGIGEILANDIVLQVNEGRITGARLALPDMAYSEDVSALEQQATDLLDLCFSSGIAGIQTASEEQARQNMRTVIHNYSGKEVKEKAAMLLKEGRPHYTSHNWARLGYDRIQEPEKAHNRLREILREEVLAEAVPLKR